MVWNFIHGNYSIWKRSILISSSSSSVIGRSVNYLVGSGHHEIIYLIHTNPIILLMVLCNLFAGFVWWLFSKNQKKRNAASKHEEKIICNYITHCCCYSTCTMLLFYIPQIIHWVPETGTLLHYIWWCVHVALELASSFIEAEECETYVRRTMQQVTNNYMCSSSQTERRTKKISSLTFYEWTKQNVLLTVCCEWKEIKIG